MHTQQVHVHVTLTHTHRKSNLAKYPFIDKKTLHRSLSSKISHVYKNIQGYSLEGNNKLNQLMIISRQMIKMPLIKCKIVSLLGSHKHYCPQMWKLQIKKSTFFSSSSPLNPLAVLIIGAFQVHRITSFLIMTLSPHLINQDFKSSTYQQR